MNIADDLLAEALAADLLLTRNGDHIHVDSPFGRPLPDTLRERIVAHRMELLAWLAWSERADELLLQMTERLTARYRRGCPLDGEQWRAAAEALTAAYHAHETATLLAAIAGYERFARECFAAYEKEHRHA